MAKFTYYIMPSEKLGQVDYEFGNIIYCEDLHRIYLDGIYGRVCYDSLMTFDTEYDRMTHENTFEGFYFVEETKTLWRYYDEEWTAITAPPSNNVIFIPKSELPEEGEYAVLYVCGDEMLTWDPVEGKYNSMTAESVWHEV